MKNLLAILFIPFSLINGQGQILNFNNDLHKFKNQLNYDSVYQIHVLDTTLFSILKITERITFLTYADSSGNLFCTNTKHKPDTMSYDSIRIFDSGYRIELFSESVIQEKRYYSENKELHAICYFKNSTPFQAKTFNANGKTLWLFFKEGNYWYSKSEKDNFNKTGNWDSFEMIEQMMLIPLNIITKPNN